MPHPDADDLALLALGESLGSAIDAHVADCAACTAEIQSFRETVDLADLSNFGEDAPRPGEHVWDAIAAELGFTGAQAGSVAIATGAAVAPSAAGPAQPDVASGSTGQTTTGPWTGAEANPTANGAAGSHVPERDSGQLGERQAPSSPTDISSARSRRWTRWAAPLAAVVVGIAVGAGAVIISQNRSDDVTIEATAPLTPVVGGPLPANPKDQLGQAELLVAPTGQEVRVNATDLPPSNNSYEVWLFGDDGRMVSLGTLSDGSGSFTVPEGINTREYRVVDVSDEPPDGKPLHSGVSLIRGAFS